MTKKFYTHVEAASLATKAYSLLAELQAEYPGIRQDLEKGQAHLLGSWGAVFKQFPDINGVDLVRIPTELRADTTISVDLSLLQEAEVKASGAPEEEYAWEDGF